MTKTLSAEAEEMLRGLERKLREARPVSSNQVVASSATGSDELPSPR